MIEKWHPATKALHSDRFSNIEYGAVHQPMHSAVAFGYKNVNDLIDVFQGKQKGYAYGRQSNPTIFALEKKITQMEKGHASICFSTGMAAIQATFFTLLKKDDHFISSQFLFGNTVSLFNSFKRIGCEVDFVDVTDIKNISKSLKANTKIVFVETIANPITQIADLKKIGEFCHQNKLIYIVDNTLTSPCSFNPIDVKATLSINSLTKYIGGHGNALGGCVTDLGQYNWNNYNNILDIYRKYPIKDQGITQIRKKGMRDGGATLSSEYAHRISVGSDTLVLRYEKSSQNAFELAKYLSSHEKIVRVNYPGLDNHPQHKRAKLLFKTFGALLSFDLCEYYSVVDFINQLSLPIASSHLGDTRTLILPVAKTIFYEMGIEKRENMSIKENTIRVSVGIEKMNDLIDDFEHAFSKL